MKVQPVLPWKLLDHGLRLRIIMKRLFSSSNHCTCCYFNLHRLNESSFVFFLILTMKFTNV